jgi:hypothetical protein
MNFFEKYKRDDLQNLIYEKNLSYREIGKIYGVSDTYIKKVANKLGISLPKRKNFSSKFIPHNKGTGKKIKCENCQTEIINPWKNQKYCSRECNTSFNINEKYLNYQKNQELYCDVDVNMGWIKKHILSEQKNTCTICGIGDIWNNKTIVFILDHIDGNAHNNTRKNLRLICPNCDSQLETYKSKNKNSARKERYLKNYK